jgi:hypothetical protein
VQSVVGKDKPFDTFFVGQPDRNRVNSWAAQVHGQAGAVPEWTEIDGGVYFDSWPAGSTKWDNVKIDSVNKRMYADVTTSTGRHDPSLPLREGVAVFDLLDEKLLDGAGGGLSGVSYKLS